MHLHSHKRSGPVSPPSCDALHTFFCWDMQFLCFQEATTILPLFFRTLEGLLSPDPDLTKAGTNLLLPFELIFLGLPYSSDMIMQVKDSLTFNILHPMCPYFLLFPLEAHEIPWTSQSPITSRDSRCHNNDQQEDYGCHGFICLFESNTPTAKTTLSSRCEHFLWSFIFF